MTARVLVRRATAALTLAFVAACSSDNNTGPKGNFSLAAQTSAVPVASGAGGSTLITIGRSGGFNGTVKFTVEGLPAGVTATVSPTIATSNVTTVRVDYAIAAGTAVGNQTFTVRGTSAGVPDQVTTVTLGVTTAPTYTVNFPSAINLPQEGSTKFTVGVTRIAGYNGVVDFQFVDLPPGVTGSFTTIAAGSGDSAIVTLTAAPLTTLCAATMPPAGLIPVRLRSMSGQLNDVFTPVGLTIVGAPGYNLAVTPCSPGRQNAPTSQDLTVAIDRRLGFTGDVALDVQGLPVGVTATTATSSGTGSTATLTLNIADTTLASTTTIRVRGRSAGLADRIANVTLLVTGLLKNKVPVANFAAALNTARFFRVVVPAGTTALTVTTSGGSGDLDLFLRAGLLPGGTAATSDCRSEGPNTNETCTISNPTPGDYFVELIGFTAYSGVTVTATTTP